MGREKITPLHQYGAGGVLLLTQSQHHFSRKHNGHNQHQHNIRRQPQHNQLPDLTQLATRLFSFITTTIQFCIILHYNLQRVRLYCTIKQVFNEQEGIHRGDMGFFSTLLGATGPAKMMAAQNALVAKYMIDNIAGPSFEELEDAMQGLLIDSGMSYEQSVRTLGGLEPKHGYLMAAAAYNKLYIPPALKGICFKDNWNHIERPLIALHGSDREIYLVSKMIYEKYGVEIDLD